MIPPLLVVACYAFSMMSQKELDWFFTQLLLDEATVDRLIEALRP